MRKEELGGRRRPLILVNQAEFSWFLLIHIIMKKTHRTNVVLHILIYK